MRPASGKKAGAQAKSHSASSPIGQTNSSETESQLVTALLELAEKFSASRCPVIGSRPVPQPAESEPPCVNRFANETGDLSSALEQIQSLITTDEALLPLTETLFAAFQGGISPYLLCRNLFPKPARPMPQEIKKEPALTAREVEVLCEAGKGLSHEQIAYLLGITSKTVEKHLEHIYRKLGLGKGSPFRAAARAAELGYLELDAVDIIASNVPGHGRYYSRLDTLCAHTGNTRGALEETGLRPLAELGLLLLMLSNLAAHNLSSYPQNAQRCGIVCELDGAGNPVRRFGTEQMGIARCIAIAPDQAAQEGFTPGNLFVGYDCVPPQHLNRGAIAEFTPEGRFVRAFCGGPNVETRLIGPLSLAFAADGALLVTSGLLTDAILRFDRGGRRIRRFAEGLYHQVAVGHNGDVYAVQCGSAGSRVAVFDSQGSRIGAVGPLHQDGYEAIAVNSQGQVIVARVESAGSVFGKPTGRVFDVYDAAGEHTATWDIGGINAGLISLDSQDRIYVPCARSQELKILSPRGQIEQNIRLESTLKPWAVAVNAQHRVWVCGRAA